MRALSLVSLAAAVEGAAVAKPEQIRSDQSPVFHYYLQAHPKNSSLVVLGPAATSEYFNIAGSIQSTNTSLFLNIGTASVSYKPLTFEKTASTTGWGLEGDPSLRRSPAVLEDVDSQYWQVYFQTGSATPSGKICSNYQSLHLHCLC